MTIECPHCKTLLFLTHLSKGEYITVGERQGIKPNQQIISKLVALNGDKLNNLACPKCNRKVKITPENIKSFQREDFEKLGIFWTVYCNYCKHIVEPLPIKKNYEEVACPVCGEKNNLSFEFISDYLGGYDSAGLSSNERITKNYYYFIKSLLTFCCSKASNFGDRDSLFIDNLIDCLSKKALSKEGEIDLQLIQRHWQAIAECFDKLSDKTEQLGIISSEGAKRTRKEWSDLLSTMTPIVGEFGTQVDITRGKTINNSVESIKPAVSNAVQDFLRESKKHPEVIKVIQDAIKEFGDDPVPKIISMIISSPDNMDQQVMASLCLFYIGQSAIPHLIDLLGHANYKVAEFAAKTLAGINGALPQLIEYLKNDNPDVRFHACGALQQYGPEAKEAIPELCHLIRKEAKSDVAGVAGGVLGRIGEDALPAFADLFRDNNPEVRMTAVVSSSKLGEKAIPILYELRNREKDDDLMKMIDNVGNRILGGGSDEMILPQGIAGPMIGLIKGIRMCPHQIELHMWERFKKESDTLIRTTMTKVGKSTNIDSQYVASILMNDIGERGIPSIAKLMGNEDRDIRAIAGDTLAAIGLPSIPYLIDALKNENVNTRTTAAGALLRIAPNGFGPKTRDVIGALSELIKTEKLDLWDITLLAARALAEVGEEAVPTLRELINAKKSSTRLAVVAAFFRMGGHIAHSILQEARCKEINFTVLEGIDYALQEIIGNNQNNTHIYPDPNVVISSKKITDTPPPGNSIAARIKRFFIGSH